MDSIFEQKGLLTMFTKLSLRCSFRYYSSEWTKNVWVLKSHTTSKNIRYLKPLNIIYLAAISIFCYLYFVVSLVQEIHIYIISVAWTIYNFVLKVEEWWRTNTRDGCRSRPGSCLWKALSLTSEEGPEPRLGLSQYFWRPPENLRILFRKFEDP